MANATEETTTKTKKTAAQAKPAEDAVTDPDVLQGDAAAANDVHGDATSVPAPENAAPADIDQGTPQPPAPDGVYNQDDAENVLADFPDSLTEAVAAVDDIAEYAREKARAIFDEFLDKLSEVLDARVSSGTCPKCGGAAFSVIKNHNRGAAVINLTHQRFDVDVYICKGCGLVNEYLAGSRDKGKSL